MQLDKPTLRYIASVMEQIENNQKDAMDFWLKTNGHIVLGEIRGLCLVLEEMKGDVTVEQIHGLTQKVIQDMEDSVFASEIEDVFEGKEPGDAVLDSAMLLDPREIEKAQKTFELAQARLPPLQEDKKTVPLPKAIEGGLDIGGN